MSYSRAAFAISLLPNHCEPPDEAEPKRNIASVFKNDFSSNILQLSYAQTSTSAHCKVNAKTAA
jgi:hypothetical protein